MKDYCPSWWPKIFCKEKASLRLRKGKTRKNLWKKRIAGSKEIFRGTSASQIKKLSTEAWKVIVWSMLSKNSDQKYELVIYSNFFRHAARICFWTACTNFWPFLQSEAKLGTKIEKWRDNDVATVLTIIKTTKNRKKAKKKNLNSLRAASRKRFFRAIS